MHRWLLAIVVMVGVTGADAAGPSVDCNGNGIEDADDIASGFSQDCNGNRVPDECDLATAFAAVSDPLSPIGAGSPQSFVFEAVPDATSDVELTVDASADISSPDFEFITVEVNGVVVGDVFLTTATDFASPPESEIIVVPAVLYDQLVTMVAGDVNVELIASADVNPILCNPPSFAVVSLAYETADFLFSEDCNENGIPDECDVAEQTSLDCNGNGVPDECEVTADVLVDSGPLMPLHFSSPQTYTLVDGPASTGSVSLVFSANGDLNSSNEFVAVTANGFSLGNVFVSPFSSCVDVEQELIVLQNPWNNLILGDNDDVVITMTPTSSVSGCSNSFISVDISYIGASDDDCNENGIPDACDLDEGTSVDCNGNGVPDECDLDCNGNGTPDECDLTAGTSPDCNGNGVPDECDVLDPALDCNGNGIVDSCGLAAGTEADCNGNGVPDACDIAMDTVEIDATLAALLEVDDDIAALVPDRFDFTNGESGTSIGDGGQDMYDGGNFLDTNLFESISYTTSMVVDSDGQFGAGSRYFTAKSTGLFVMAAVDIAIDSFSVTGFLGADGQGVVDGSELTTTVQGRPYTIYLKRVYGTTDTSVNHIIIVPGAGDGLTRTFSTNTNNDDHIVSGLFDRDAIYFLLVSRWATMGLPLEEPDALALADAFLATLGLGTSTDCNGNGIPDDCDLALGTSEDCNANAFPDECDPDCDANGVVDECEIAAATAEDCNANGRPDACDLFSGRFEAASGPMSPLGVGFPHTLFVPTPPLAAGPVQLSFEAIGDLSSSGASVSVDLNGIVVGSVFVSGFDFCPDDPDFDEITLDPTEFNATFGAGALEIMLTPTAGVDNLCPNGTFISVSISYESTGLDVDGDGLVDACESCPGDVDGDGEVQTSDLLLVLAQWGPCAPVCIADIDDDDEVGVDDLLTVLSEWGSCP